MKSPYFTEDHEIFRGQVRKFVQAEALPFAEQWEAERKIPREFFRRMGELGFLGINHPEEYGGSGADLFYSVVFLEELGRAGLASLAGAVAVQEYMATAHLSRVGSEELKQRFLVPSIAGEKVGALAISEPDAGSDVASLRTRAEASGEEYVLNGAKTFITNGVYGDFATVAVKTDPAAGLKGISLIVVEAGTPGFSVSRKLDKLGYFASDTAELVFEDARVPASNLIGEEGRGFYYLMESFEMERLVAAIFAVGLADCCLDKAIAYARQREAFGGPILRLQALRHRLADLITEVEAARHLVYHTAWLVENGVKCVKECSMSKLLATELAKRAADEGLQVLGGYGYMEEYPLARLYRDTRAGTIVAGTSEIMREIIAKLHLDEKVMDRVYEAG